MTIEEAIKHCLDIADGQDKCAEISVSKHAKERISQCAADHRQLAKWLRELKDLREVNNVLINECDRLIKEKGELLNKVSGGDVLRICQLEDRLQVELDNSHCLEIELKEAKRLLKAAMEDMKILYETGKDEGCIGIEFKWRYADEALKLIGGEA
jgi:hypothetical protein